MPSTLQQTKPRLSFLQIFNMSFGFFGIQFGWSLQMGNMSAIYEYLHASPDQIPLLFLAAPLTGLIVQPIIGYLSDRTWHPLFGRRRPYFLSGRSSVPLPWFSCPTPAVCGWPRDYYGSWIRPLIFRWNPSGPL